MSTTLGERIRARRQRKGWKLKDLAEKTGLSVAYLSDLERQHGTNPTLETVSNIARALDCDVSGLVGSPAGTDSTRAQRGSDDMPPLSMSLQRFLSDPEFSAQLKELASRAGRPVDDVFRREVVEFLAHAPRRSKGDLSKQQWRALLDFYTYMVIPDR